MKVSCCISFLFSCIYVRREDVLAKSCIDGIVYSPTRGQGQWRRLSGHMHNLNCIKLIITSHTNLKIRTLALNLFYLYFDYYF